MKVAVLIEKMYEDLEAWYPYLRLREAGISTVFVGPGTDKSYPSKHGYPAAEELSIGLARSQEFDGVIIPGGYAPDHIRRSQKMLDFVRDINAQGKLVAAICHAGWVLASADIIRGKKVTGYYSIKDDLTNAGAQFIDAEVVVDGNLITSRNPFDLPAFAGQIVQFLKSRQPEPAT